MANPERFVNFDIGQPQALRDAVNSVFGASGAAHAAGLVPDPGSTPGTTNFLREDGTWQTPADPVFGASGAGHASGDVPDPGAVAGTTRFLREDATWTAPAISAGILVSVVAYSTSQTITIPATATKAFIRMWGGSGGSGGVDANATSVTGGTGSGGYLEKYLTGLTSGNTLAYTNGAAGAAGASTPTNGGNGTASTLASGTQVISTLTANGSNGSLAATLGTQTASTAGGTATGGDFNAPAISGEPVIAGFIAKVPGMNLYSPGAYGKFTSGTASAGNAGNPGGMIIFWFT